MNLSDLPVYLKVCIAAIAIGGFFLAIGILALIASEIGSKK